MATFRGEAVTTGLALIIETSRAEDADPETIRRMERLKLDLESLNKGEWKPTPERLQGYLKEALLVIDHALRDDGCVAARAALNALPDIIDESISETN